MKVILSIDQGTTGSTAVLINAETMNFVGKCNIEYEQIYPKPSWVEHNLNAIWNSVEAATKAVLEKTNTQSKDIVAIGITNQRETICPFRKSGSPLRNAIVWQDRRTEEFCNSISLEEKEKLRMATGLPLDPYFSGTKIKWMIENDSTILGALSENDCLFGTIDTFLIYKLTNGKSFFTEPSNASRTLLYNLKKGDWCEDLLKFFGVSKATLPEIKNSFDNFGKTEGLSFLPDGIPITGVLGDQQAALFGQAGIKEGMSKCTYGTGAFYLMNIGEEVRYSDKGLLTTVAYRENGKDYFAFEGSCYIAGAAVQWIRDNLKFFEKSYEVEALARQDTDESMEKILFLPFFTGLGTPYWVSDAQAALIGLTRDSGKEQISRACLEGICLSINDLIEVMEEESGYKVEELKVDGGAVENSFLTQSQANFSNTKIIKPVVIETTAYGAAFAAAIGNGTFSKSDLASKWKEEKSFIPNPTDYNRIKKEKWKIAIERIYLK